LKIEKFLDLNLNVLIFDWRGYGKSKGRPSEKGLYKDGEAMYDWLLKKTNGKDIIFYGESLGCAVAVENALKHKAAAIILESPFSSVKDMIRTHYKILFPFSFAAKHKFDTLQKIPSVKSPILIIHSGDDEIVPSALARKLFEAANNPKAFLSLRGGHNDGFLVSEKDYTSGVENFLRQSIGAL
jgi:fermentation-respiration switch protein FrsA (DUF1100 family)